MTDSPLPELLKAGEEALEYEPGRLDEFTVEQIVDVVGRAVLHAAAEQIRALGGADPNGGFAGYDEGMEIAAAWIDPEPPQPKTGFRWHPLSECPDETGCPIHGRETGEPTGPEDTPDPSEVHPQAASPSGGAGWMWRCNGIRWCTGAMGLHYDTEDDARAGYEQHARDCHLDQPTERQLHSRYACPGWEYATTEGPRKQWDDADRPPSDENGDPDPSWERNADAGRNGWDRFDYTEESYWRRRIGAGSAGG